MTLRNLFRYLRTRLITAPLALLSLASFGFTDTVLSLCRASFPSLHRNARRWCGVLLWSAGIRIRTHGLENVPQGSCVFVANHMSFADTPVVIAYLPATFRFLAKDSLFRLPIIGWHLRRAGHIRVTREQARSAAKALVEAGRNLREKNVSILVFAEGSRSEEGLKAFKAGAAHLAIRNGVPVVPVALAGTQHVLPKGTVHMHPGQVHLCIGEPIPTEGMSASDQDELTQRVRDRVFALLGETVQHSA